MPTYVYRARRLDGSLAEGTLPADNERAALLSLDRMGLFPLQLTPGEGQVSARNTARRSARLGAGEAGPAPAPAPPRPMQLKLWQRRVGRESAARFARELADLSEAGVPLLKALDALAEAPAQEYAVEWGAKEAQSDLRAREALRDARREVAQGSALAEAFERRPELFGPTETALIRAGETGGFLPAALRRVALFGEREASLARRVRGALAYPALLSLLSGGAVVFLLMWVVPRFAVIYEDMGGALPAPTQLLIAIAALLRTAWPVLLLGLVGGAVALGQALSTEDGLARRDRLLLKVPLLRRVVAQAAIARFSSTLGTLLGSGVAILQALEIARTACGNREFQTRLTRALGATREGAALAVPLAETRLFPGQVIEMLTVGQETGTLAEVLERIGTRADEDVDQALRAFVTVFEPTLIVLVAGVVFFVVLAALLPVFTLNTLVH